MKKYGLLVCAGEAEYKNIGDHIQSLAQAQFLPHIDCLVEREALNTFKSKEEVNVIMNAWFMHHPENFPPSPGVKPLYISFHITPAVADKMLTKEAVEHLKKNEPIGCRDKGTQRILESKGIKAYFSGCLTVTLGETYQSAERSDEILFVDPYFERSGTLKRWQKVCLLLSKPLVTYRISRRINTEFSRRRKPNVPSWLNRWLTAIVFYATYSKLFSDDVLTNAVYIDHEVKRAPFADEQAKLDYAKNLLHRYAKAKYVVTSRIHAALPCLGLDTPCIFVNGKNLEGKDAKRPSGRFEGLAEWLRVACWEPAGVVLEDEELRQLLKGKKMTRTTAFSNKDTYKTYKSQLMHKVKEFLMQNQ